jgi:hypothetical protein
MKIQRMTRTVALFAAVTAVALASSDLAWAQAWIGQIAGEMAAEEQQAALERACLAGAPADPDDVAKANKRIEKAMDAYFELTSSSTPRQIRRVFTSDKDDIRWKDTSGEVPLDQLGARLDLPTPQRTLEALVVGGDDMTAQAIWSVSPVEGSDIAYYGGDFVNEGWLGGWKLWHLQVFRAAAKPDVPHAFCHFDSDQSF